ncbi:hypothetical protein L915_20794 [Phytophthora nicotianae]|uniref:Uncharacterized protein n=1 Tax=Phytophthora nicotianae TaxID=4792 RepID=W2FPS1_PHYNI|nr:hypothetical protein L915_20794 [Phytophthora nicotianae]
MDILNSFAVVITTWTQATWKLSKMQVGTSGIRAHPNTARWRNCSSMTCQMIEAASLARERKHYC